MAITIHPPRTIHLAGDIVIVDEFPAGEEITPGHLIEKYNDGGAIKWRKHATSTEAGTNAVALDRPENNYGIDTVYAAGHTVKAGIFNNGGVFYGLIASGQDISKVEALQSAGGGTVKSATATTAAAGVYKMQSLDAPGAVTVSTRIRVEFIQ
jgi:hypothetical protein